MNDSIFIEDDDFLSLVAAAEADALSATAKRRKTTTTTTTKTEEGIYTAALRGSKSLLFQQQSPKLSDPIRPTNQSVVFSGVGGGGDGAGGGGAGNSCFKCGGLGHWARDCSGGGSDREVPEKLCGCGAGNCLVLTANTEKNRGRKFYRCPIREENGGCGFFEWCDNSSGNNNMSFGRPNYATTPSFPDLPCPCGAGACLVLTAKTGNNVGQQFYRCPKNQENSCGFFKWCNENTTATVKSYSNTNDTGSNNYGVRSVSSPSSSSSCFKCGKEGHWAKDCTATSSFSPNDAGPKTTSSSTCYKCGQPGHWARDCSAQDGKTWPRH